MPTNIKVSVHYSGCYTNKTVAIKDILKQVNQELSTLVLSNIKLRYEISTTTIDEQNFYSDFIFDNVDGETIKWSNGGKSTIVKHNERLYSTTLLIKNTTNDLGILMSFILSGFER